MCSPHPQSPGLVQSQALVLFEAARVILLCSRDRGALILTPVMDSPLQSVGEEELEMYEMATETLSTSFLYMFP